MKLHFLARFRSLLKSKESSPCKPRHDHHQEQEQELKPPLEVAALKVEEDENEEVVLQSTVKKLHFGNLEEKEKAAIQIEKLAREDVKTRKVMGELGVVQVLVSMVDSDVFSHQEPALKALLQLSHGNYSNKALMLKAGICSKLPKTIETLSQIRRHNFSELLFSISSLPNTQFPVYSTSQILPFLIQILNSNSTEIKTKDLCISTINNLSLALENAGPLVSNGAIPTLTRLISTQDLSEKALSSLGQLVVTQMGKKAMEESSNIPESLIEILTWENKPKCQEYSAYILMVLAHQSWSQREKMAKAGIVEALLEVALLGTPLVQKRAVKLLQWFKDERNSVRVGPHSGPQTGRVSPVIGSPRAGEEGRRMMKNLVKQSLYKNMEMITRRGNNNLDYNRSNKSLVISTSSKSLPY